MCAYIQSFPRLETVYAVEEGDGPRAALLDTLRKAKPTLRIVAVFSGSLYLKWTVDAQEQQPLMVDDHE
jgi:hypothetical protein